MVIVLCSIQERFEHLRANTARKQPSKASLGYSAPFLALNLCIFVTRTLTDTNPNGTEANEEVHARPFPPLILCNSCYQRSSDGIFWLRLNSFFSGAYYMTAETRVVQAEGTPQT